MSKELHLNCSKSIEELQNAQLQHEHQILFSVLLTSQENFDEVSNE